MTLVWRLCLLLLLSLILPPQPASAAKCSGGGEVAGGEIGIAVVCSEPGGNQPGTPTGAGASTPSPFVAYEWASICTIHPDVNPGDLDCVAAFGCADPDQRLWQLWGRLRNGDWRTVTTGCFGGTPPAYEPPTVTPGDVLTALRRVGLPELATVVQPEGKTLVNFDTNFYTEPSPVTLTLTLLGQRVDVEATPASYRWDFGDGTTVTTTDPGGAYPDLTVTHRYADARVTVRPHVTTTYTARFRVGGGGEWQDVGGTVTAAGPATALRVAEATPLLSGEHR